MKTDLIQKLTQLTKETEIVLDALNNNFKNTDRIFNSLEDMKNYLIELGYKRVSYPESINEERFKEKSLIILKDTETNLYFRFQRKDITGFYPSLLVLI